MQTAFYELMKLRRASKAAKRLDRKNLNLLLYNRLVLEMRC